MGYMMKKTLLILGGVALLALVAIGAFFLGRGSQPTTKSTDNQTAVSEQANTSTSENNTEQAETKSTEAASASPKPLVVSASGNNAGEITYTITSSWGDDKTTYTQIDAVIQNKTDADLEGWNVNLTVPKGSKMNQNWNGQMKLKDTNLNIQPADYNQTISAGGTVEFGFIIETPSAYVPEKSDLTIG